MTIGSYKICKRLGFDTYTIYSLETCEKVAGGFDSMASAAEWLSTNAI